MTVIRTRYIIIATAVVLCGKAARVTNSSNRVSGPAHSARVFGVWRANVGHAYRGRVSRLPKANLCVPCLQPDYDSMGKYFASCRLEVLPTYFLSRSPDGLSQREMSLLNQSGLGRPFQSAKGLAGRAAKKFLYPAGYPSALSVV